MFAFYSFLYLSSYPYVILVISSFCYLCYHLRLLYSFSLHVVTVLRLSFCCLCYPCHLFVSPPVTSHCHYSCYRFTSSLTPFLPQATRAQPGGTAGGAVAGGAGGAAAGHPSRQPHQPRPPRSLHQPACPHQAVRASGGLDALFVGLDACFVGFDQWFPKSMISKVTGILKVIASLSHWFPK